MFISKILKLGLFSSLLITQITFAQTISLQEAIEKALNNNLQVKKAINSTELSSLDYQQAKRNRLPNLNSTISQNAGFGLSQNQVTFTLVNTQNFNTSLGLSSSVNLFSGLTALNQIKQNKILFETDLVNVDKAKNDLVLQVVTTYLDAMINKDLLAAAKLQLELDQKNLNQQNQLLEAGNKTMADVAQAKSQVATSELNVTTSQNNLTVAILTLSQLMELPMDQKFDVQVPIMDDLNALELQYEALDVFQKSQGIFPDIKLAELRTASAKKSIDIAKGALYPKLGLSAGINSFASFVTGFQTPAFPMQVKNNFGQFIGLSLNIPIFNGFQARTNIKKARVNYMNAELDEKLQKNNLRKVVTQALVDLNAASSRYESTQKTFDAQKENFYVISERYKVGVANSLDYNTALTNRNKSENDNIQAKYSLIFRAKVIDYYLGNPLKF